MINTLRQTFETHFSSKNCHIFFSPGRVNLIGEHIDYNGGFVFPCALSLGTYGVASIREDKLISVFSEPFSVKPYTFSLSQLIKDNNHSWVDYIKGSIQALLDHGYTIPYGINLYIKGTMPMSAGLSSSASIEMLIMTIMNHFFNLNLDQKTMALLGKYTENHYIGVNSGIMDQFAVIAGKKDHALLLNTDTLAFDYVPLDLNDDALLIVNTNKKRGLADSKYNERYQECQDALHLLKPFYNINHLCELKATDLPRIQNLINPILFKRVRHVITEQERTLKSKDALQKGDIDLFSHLMTSSHESLRDDYEVTGIELDTLQDALLQSGAKGARMTGAGFGGCVVAVIPKDQLDIITYKVKNIYQKQIGYEPTFYEVKTSDGAKIINETSL